MFKRFQFSRFKNHQGRRWLALLGLVLLVSGCSRAEQQIALTGNTMGTSYHIKLVPNETLPEPQKLQAEIDAALERVNSQMSTYRPDSELSRFNQLAADQSIEVSAETIGVIEEGVRLHGVTDGALDISLGPLVNLWGFGPDKRPVKTPTQEQIDATKAETGIHAFSIDGLSLTKANPGLYLDLSAIAKGYGVDIIARLLDGYGVSGYLVEIGGELSVKGHKADNSPWRVAVEQPSESERVIQQVIAPGTMAMATSGDYRNYFEADGKRFSHLIDPRSGYPIDHRLASVTVLHKECMTADGLATAMMVLGTEASLALAEKENLAIMLIEKQDEGFKVYYSDAFKAVIDR
jgi:FAD:protein FMN transferase